MDIKVIYSSGGKYNKSRQQKIADGETVDDAKLVVAALIKKGHSAETVKITPSKIGAVKDLRADAIFNLVEWSGKDYPLAVKVLKYMEAGKIPFTGADSKSYEWCCDKISMKSMFDQLKITTPAWTSINSKNTKEEIEDKIGKIPFPIIIKPAYEHCAIGIDSKSVIHKRKGALGKILKLLDTYREPVLVEQFIKGREFTVTVLKNHNLHVFPPAEIIFKTKNPENILSFQSQWIDEQAPYTSKIVKQKELAANLKKVAKEAFLKMSCRGYIRVDMRMDKKKVYVLEVNINPDIAPTSYYGLTVSTEAAGWNFNKLINEIANAAVSNFQN